MIGTTRGRAPVLEAKLPHRGSLRDPIENIHMEDIERLLVEGCYGNCLRCNSLNLSKVISPSFVPFFYINIFFVFRLK